MWVDIGVNLTDERLPTEQTIKDSREAGLSGLIITATDIASANLAIQDTQTFPNYLRTTAGIHPHYTADADDNALERLRDLAAHEHVVAIGECGLDFNRNFSPQQTQLDWFEKQLQLAVECQLPVFLHERDAFDEQIELLKAYRSSLIGGVAHCFTGNANQMRGYLDLGLYIGVTGWLCDEKRGAELREAVKELPLEHIMLETDAPYLFPKTLRPRQRNNIPANLPYIAEQVASLMGVTIEDLSSHSSQNTLDLFGWAGSDT